MLTHPVNSKNPRNWHKRIPFLLTAYRSMEHETTGASPFMLVHGREPRSALDVMYDAWSGLDKELPKLSKDDTKFVLELKNRLQVAQEAAACSQSSHEQKYVEIYNKRAKVKEFNVGDQVLILMPDSTSKVKSKWLGPGVVTERAAQFSYFVKLEDGSTRLLHVNKLRLFCKRVVDVDSVTVLDDLDIEFGDLVEYPLLSDHSELEEEIAKLDLSHLSVEE